MHKSSRVRTVVSASLIGLAIGACEGRNEGFGRPQKVSEAEANQAVRMLKAGDNAVCASQAVTDMIMSIVKNGWMAGAHDHPTGWKMEEREQFFLSANVRLSGITSTTADKSVPWVACEATFSAQGSAEGWENRIGYELTLQLDTDEVRTQVVDIAPALDVLEQASQPFHNQIVTARIRRERDQLASSICSRFRPSRGRWSAEELSDFSSEFYQLWQQYDFSLGAEGQACWRQVQSDIHNGQNAARQQRLAELAATVQREELEENRRRVDRIEVTAPPDRVDSPPPNQMSIPTASRRPPPSGQTFTPD